MAQEVFRLSTVKNNIINIKRRNERYHGNSLGDSDLLIKGVNQTIKNEKKIQTTGFLRMLLGTLSASLLGNMLVYKGVTATSLKAQGVIRAGKGVAATSQRGWGAIRTGNGVIQAGKGTIRRGQDF